MNFTITITGHACVLTDHDDKVYINIIDLADHLGVSYKNFRKRIYNHTKLNIPKLNTDYKPVLDQYISMYRFYPLKETREALISYDVEVLLNVFDNYIEDLLASGTKHVLPCQIERVKRKITTTENGTKSSIKETAKIAYLVDMVNKLEDRINVIENHTVFTSYNQSAQSGSHSRSGIPAPIRQ